MRRVACVACRYAWQLRLLTASQRPSSSRSCGALVGALREHSTRNDTLVTSSGDVRDGAASATSHAPSSTATTTTTTTTGATMSSSAKGHEVHVSAAAHAHTTAEATTATAAAAAAAATVHDADARQRGTDGATSATTCADAQHDSAVRDTVAHTDNAAVRAYERFVRGLGDGGGGDSGSQRCCSSACCCSCCCNATDFLRGARQAYSSLGVVVGKLFDSVEQLRHVTKKEMAGTPVTAATAGDATAATSTEATPAAAAAAVSATAAKAKSDGGDADVRALRQLLVREFVPVSVHDDDCGAVLARDAAARLPATLRGSVELQKVVATLMSIVPLSLHMAHSLIDSWRKQREEAANLYTVAAPSDCVLNARLVLFAPLHEGQLATGSVAVDEQSITLAPGSRLLLSPVDREHDHAYNTAATATTTTASTAAAAASKATQPLSSSSLPPAPQQQQRRSMRVRARTEAASPAATATAAATATRASNNNDNNNNNSSNNSTLRTARSRMFTHPPRPVLKLVNETLPPCNSHNSKDGSKATAQTATHDKSNNKDDGGGDVLRTRQVSVHVNNTARLPIPGDALAVAAVRMDVVVPPGRYTPNYDWYYTRVEGYESEYERIAAARIFAMHAPHVLSYVDFVARMLTGSAQKFLLTRGIAAMLGLPSNIHRCPPAARKLVVFYLDKTRNWTLADVVAVAPVLATEVSTNTTV